MIISEFGAMPQSESVVATPAVAEVVNPNQFFDFEATKVQQLTLDQLKRTNKENRGDDRSCPHGIYHFALIQQVLDMCAEHGYNAEVYDLFATNNRDKQTPGVSLYPELEKKYGERAVEAHTLRRVYANIRLKDFDTPELTTNLAIAYTQKGIQVGFGRNVKICHNQMILGAERIVSDFSYRKNSEPMSLQSIIQVIGGWLTDAEHLIIKDNETIERMKQSVLTPEQIYVIIGMLTSFRVMSETQNKAIRRAGIIPLNQAQIGKFTESLLIKQHKESRITAWSLYNCATDLYKPQTAETNLILGQNLAMMEFLREQQVFV